METCGVKPNVWPRQRALNYLQAPWVSWRVFGPWLHPWTCHVRGHGHGHRQTASAEVSRHQKPLARCHRQSLLLDWQSLGDVPHMKTRAK